MLCLLSALPRDLTETAVQDKSEVETLIFPACSNTCGETTIRSVGVRHPVTAMSHAPRIREHLLHLAGFVYYYCDGLNKVRVPGKGDNNTLKEDEVEGEFVGGVVFQGGHKYRVTTCNMYVAFL